MHINNLKIILYKICKSVIILLSDNFLSLSQNLKNAASTQSRQFCILWCQTRTGPHVSLPLKVRTQDTTFQLRYLLLRSQVHCSSIRNRPWFFYKAL